MRAPTHVVEGKIAHSNSCESKKRTTDASLVECRSVDIGGGRGLFVTTDVLAGTVLLTDEPVVFVAAEDVGASESHHMAVARCILQGPRHADILIELQGMHPQQLGDLSHSVLAEVRSKHSAAARMLMNSAVAPITLDNALILLLKVQWNAFDVGFCVNLAMTNHSCFPNCKVFGPGERAEGTTRPELVATRALRAGEQATISYFGGVEHSASRRAKLFERQFLVPLVVGSDVPVGEFDALANGDGDSILSKDAVAHIEDRLDCLAYKEQLESVEGRHVLPAATLLEDMTVLEKSMERLLHPRHLVLGRIHKLMQRAALVQLDAAFNANIAERLIRASTELLATQSLSLGDTHWDLIETTKAIAFGIAALLSYDPKHLFAVFPSYYGDFRTASLAEAALRKKAASIHELYTPQAEVPHVHYSKLVPNSACPSASSQEGKEVDWSIFE